MAILVTGGAGYIGSHTCVELLNSGYEIIVVDNLSNRLDRIYKSSERNNRKKFKFYKEDVLNQEALDAIFEENAIEAVIHFAGFKAVGESVAIPLTYYHNNITSTLVLCEVMQKHNVKKMILVHPQLYMVSRNVTDYRGVSIKCNKSIWSNEIND